MAERGDFPEEVPTPVGVRGRIIQWEGPEPKLVAYHRDCFDEAASMGIGG